MVEILIVTCIVYGVLLLLRGTTAMALLRGIGALFLLGFVLSTVFQLTMLGWLLRNSLPAMLVVIPVLFQPELRRVLEQVGRGLRGFTGVSPVGSSAEVIETLARGAQMLAERRCGALIVLERDTGLQEYIERGVALDALLSPDLLVSIFFPNSPLHDGAIIVRRGRVVAARCIMPLTENVLQPHLGMRHRAGVGISERTDAVVLLVSEETGRVTLASAGRLTAPLDGAGLRAGLFSLLGPKQPAPPARNGWAHIGGRRPDPAPQPAERNAP